MAHEQMTIILPEQQSLKPDGYLLPNAPFRRRRSLNALLHDETERVVKAEDSRLWIRELVS